MADWRKRAACRDQDPERFFPVGTSGPALLQIAEAKTVCRRCPVDAECLSWALATGQEAGVWGGFTEDERRDLSRRGIPAIAPKPAPVPAPPAVDPAVVDTIRRLAATHLTDTQIGMRLGRGHREVTRLRAAAGIPAGDEMAEGAAA